MSPVPGLTDPSVTIFVGAPTGSPFANAHNTYDHNLNDHNLYARISGTTAGETVAVRADPRFVAPDDVRSWPNLVVPHPQLGSFLRA